MTHLPMQDEIKLSEIDLGDRARKDYRDLDMLASSITEKGLIHPIAISLNDNGSGKPYKLVAGGRRFRAHEKLGKETILCRIYQKELSNLEYRSIELEENIQREDLSWQEKAFLEREIHRLQITIHGQKVSKLSDAQGHSMADTAALLGVSKAKVSKDISLADAIEMFPEAPWAKCKNAHDANKLKNRMENTIVNEHLAKVAQTTMGNASGKVKTLLDAYLITDFFKIAKTLPSESFDLIECDPPYGIDLKDSKSKKAGGSDGLVQYNEVDKQAYPEFLAKTFKECYRLLKNDSYMICWFAPDPWYELVASLLEGVGFKVPRIPAIWTKPNGQTNSPAYRLANAYEMFFYAAKGSPQIVKQGRSNVFDYAPLMPDKKRHPTQRPGPMIKEVLETFTKPNSKILVPFAGSGETLIQAVEANMIPLGFDLASSFRDRYVLFIKETMQ